VWQGSAGDRRPYADQTRIWEMKPECWLPGCRTERLPVAVGTIITDRPPHRSVRALLRIRLPPRMAGVKALHRIRMKNARDRNPSLREPAEPGQGDPTPLTAAS
jgi:hypothetical protein